MMQHDLKPRWTDEEISFLKFAYPNKEFTMDEILKAFPNRSYHAIRFQARRLNLKRYSEPEPPKGYKRCSSCDTILPLSWFSKNKTKKYGKHARCKVCDARCFEKSKNGQNDQNGQNGVFKKCRSCGNEKKIDDFYRNKTAKDGRVNHCKFCVAKKQRTRYIKGGY